MKSKFKVSQFEEDIQTGLDDGLPFYQAKQRAVDSYRKFQAREKTDVWNKGELIDIFEPSPDAILMNEGNWLDANLPIDERMSVNEIVGLMFEFAQDWKEPGSSDRIVAMKWVCRIVRLANVEHILKAEIQAVVNAELGTADIDFKADIAELSGFASRENRRVPNEYEAKLREFLPALASYIRSQTTDWYERMGA